MTILITLTAGADVGPFELRSNFDGYATAWESGISRASLIGGYLSTLIPTGSTIVRAQSTGVCTNYIDSSITPVTTTTTTTTLAPVVLQITSSVALDGSGTLDFINGEPNEVLTLTFNVFDGGSNVFESLIFDSPVVVSILDPLHLSRTGSVTLDISGAASSIYTYSPISPDSICTVTITGRSSAEPIPVINSTNL
jgi:hypothetical protein